MTAATATPATSAPRAASAGGGRARRAPRIRRRADSRFAGRLAVVIWLARSASAPRLAMRSASASVTGQIRLISFMRGLRSERGWRRAGGGPRRVPAARRLRARNSRTRTALREQPRTTAISPWPSPSQALRASSSRSAAAAGGTPPRSAPGRRRTPPAVLGGQVGASGRSAPTGGARPGDGWPAPAATPYSHSRACGSRGMSSSRRHAVRNVSAMMLAASSGLSVRRSTYPRIGPRCAAYTPRSGVAARVPVGLGGLIKAAPFDTPHMSARTPSISSAEA